MNELFSRVKEGQTIFVREMFFSANKKDLFVGKILHIDLLGMCGMYNAELLLLACVQYTVRSF